MSNKIITLDNLAEFKSKCDEHIEEITNAAIQADKDIISQVIVEYDEDANVTYFNFPENIMPLSITLNTHILYFKNSDPVDWRGNEVAGYELDETGMDDGKAYLAFIGDLSEQVINGLVYINYNGNSGVPPISYNSYYLFYPFTSVGTKLYKHSILVNGNSYFVCVTDKQSPAKLKNYQGENGINLEGHNIISIEPYSIFTNPPIVTTQYLSEKNHGVIVRAAVPHNSTPTVSTVPITTVEDTVTEL